MTQSAATAPDHGSGPAADDAAAADAAREELVRRRLAGAGRRGGRDGRIAPADRSRPLRLAFGQEQLWFLNRLEPDSAEYLVPLALRLTGPLDRPALARAWDAIVARHEILRTRYTMVEDEPVQLVDPAPGPGSALALAELDLTALAGHERAEQMERQLALDATTGFDLERDWPVRGRLLCLAADEHVLSVVFHHIACDAWSTEVFLRELCEGYAAYTAEPQGRPAKPADTLPIQYADYAAWQRATLSGGLLEKQLGYWRSRLCDLAPLELPADRPRPPVRDWHGSAVPFELPEDLAAGLRALAEAQNVTLFVAFLASFQALLSRYTGATDIPVGTVVSGRGRPELQGLIGYGINSLVVRGLWDGDPRFAGLLAGARTAVLDAFDHREIPFARLVDELQPERDLSRTPLYQVAFTMHEGRAADLALPGVQVEAVPAQWRVAKVDLTLHIETGADGRLRGLLEYADALFDRTTVERMVRHYLRLLAQVTADPGTRVSDIALYDDTELSVLLETAGTGRVEPPTARLDKLFEERVRVSPDAVAVVFEGVGLSYAGLNVRANRIARRLVGLGVGRECVVGVCLERGLDLVPALLGVLKSGAGYLPLDPVQPVERLGFMVGDAGVSVVVTDSVGRGCLPADFGGVVVVLDEEDLEGLSGSDLGVSGGPDDLVYVIYTSGSTGRPKGVCLSHGNVVRLLSSAQEHYGFDESDVWPLFHSYAFDVSVWELWGALLQGGRLVVVPRGVTRSPDDFLDLLVGHGVTVLNQTPSAFRGLVRLAGEGDPRIDRLSLRAVVFAGEKLEFAELAPWTARRDLAQTRLLNMYGITETTVHTTFHQVTQEEIETATGNPIGRPLADLRVYLLDARGGLVPVGVPGEIYVGGPGVARGYLGRPELTAERFVPDPFGGAPGARLYRSGDLARRLPDGRLEFCGRIDDQVKIRGYRIELGEIEAALAAVPGIRDAVVVVREDTPGDKRLVGYGVPAGGQAPAPGDIRALLSQSLPDYMIPSVFVPLAALPLTANGKLDKRALPAPDQRTQTTAGEYVAPRTPVEERIAAVWSAVLRVNKVGVDDGFFDLGGDSIRAVALVGALRTAGFDVAVRDVFEFRTVALLAGFVTGRPAPAEAAAPVAPFALISAADRARLPESAVDAYPLSQVQAGMLVEMLAGDGQNNYHNVTSFRIVDQTPFSEAALRAAAAVVVARHEVLRTGIDLSTYSRPLQLVHESAVMPVEVHDLTGQTQSSITEHLHAYSRRERATLFDLATPTLLRIGAHACDGGVWWISVTECHAVLEGWSHHSLLMELLACYRRIRDGLEPEPVALPEVRFADFIAAELESLESAQDQEYWGGIVADYPRFALPTGWGTTDPDAPRGTYVVAAPYHDLQDGLRALAAKARVSMKAVVLAAHLKVLSQLTDEAEFSAGLVCDARPEIAGADRVYGMYLNTVPFAVDREARTWRELVQQVFDREVRLWPHRRFPLPAIQRLAGGTKLIEVYFNYQDFNQVDTNLVDYQASIDESPTEFPLTVSSRAGAFMLTANPRSLSLDNAQRIAAMYRAVVEAMVADSEGDARAVYLPEGERELLRALAGGEVELPVTQGIHEAFEAAAARYPDAVAVAFEQEELDYRELNERANRLAHRLRELGAGPERLVGVCLERGPDLVPTLLGVLKSGAGYLPLDPALPADRLAFMLGDAQAPVVVTSGRHAAGIAEFYQGALVDLDRDAEELRARPDENPPSLSGPGNLAYVIYTSGSTGRPKGVSVTHANVLRLMAAGDRHYHFTPEDVWPLFHSFAFDVSVWELWGSLLYGGRLVVVPQQVTRSPEDFLDLLVEHGVTVLNQTPSAFKGLIRLAADGDPRIGRLRLRAVVFAGEKLEFDDLHPWTDRLGLQAPELLNMYGITETTVHTTFHRLAAADLAAGAGNQVGRPLADLTVHILDREGYPAPLGVPGEIHVGGPGVTRGYLNRPELTAQRFVPDPFGAPGSRLYRSGDLARRLPDGTLEFYGRIDDQVKIRGFRIELGEITAVLADHPGVRDAVVLVREDQPGDRRLVAYCVPAGAEPVPAGELAEHCAGRLPGYMVPAAFVALPVLPLTVNGKLDRRALPAPDRSALRADQHYLAPRTPVEERIAAVWAEVLGVARVGVTDGFFDLGGDSIRAVTLVGATRAAGFDVAVRDVFEYQTVERLAELLTGRPAPAGPAEPVARFALIDSQDRAKLPADAVDAYPLSQAQVGMLVAMLAQDGQNAYHNVNSFMIPDERGFDLAALEAAARVLTERHEILRTSAELVGYSVPMQVVHAEARIPVAVHDLRGLGDMERRARVAEFVAAERDRLFDLGTAPLLRFTVHLVDGGWRMSFTQSHAITEGWSYHSMLMELLTCYREVLDGVEPGAAEPGAAETEAAEPAAPAVRYADFIAAELESLAGEEDRAYWRALVESHPKFALPSGWCDEPAPAPDAPREAIRGGVSLRPFDAALRALAADCRVSLKAVLLAVHLKVLSQLTEQESFSAGLVCDARPEVLGADRVYGMHLNTLPFGHDRGARTWRDLVRQVFAREVELWPHRRFPLPAVQREAGRESLIDVIFTYLDFHIVDTEQVDSDETISDSPTEFGLSVTTIGGYLGLSSSTRYFNRVNMNRLSAMYEAVLTAMTADPDGDARATCLPAGERDLLLGEVNRVVPAAPVRPPHELFQEHAAARPGATALVFGDTRLTYAELNARANRLAHNLRARGVGPERLVGVHLERGVEVVVSILAILKAGGAYLPLDPAYPADRRAYMLAESGAGWLISDSALMADAGQGSDTSEPSGAAGPGYELILLDQEDFSDHPGIDPQPSASAGNLMYVIFTSGSTGRPKGVCVTHANVHRLFTSTSDDYGFDEHDVWTLFHSYAFDVSVWELWGALMHGGTLVVVPFDVARSPEDFLELMVEHRATILCQTPSAFRSLAAAAAQGDARLERLDLRAVVFAGEKLEPAELAPWAGRLGLDRPQLINMYGITETTVHTTYYRLDESDFASGAPSRVGRKIDDLTLHLLSPEGDLVPLGVPGEIFVGGPGVTRGYLNRPELTAQRFVPDPFAAGQRLYRSGDLARRRADGGLDFLGRIDDQVKIRGYRIELGEISAVLAAQPGVREAVAVARGESLVGYYVPAEGCDPDIAVLRSALGVRLPDYMVPAFFVRLEAIPLGSTGKLDRRALPAPDLAALGDQVGRREPATATERRLAEIYAEVLGLERVGVDAGFFELGGDSLRAVALVGALRLAGFDLGVRDVFQYQSVARLAELLDARPASAAGDAARFVPVAPFALIDEADRRLLPPGVTDAYPAAQAQLGMAVAAQNATGRTLYHIVSSFRIRDDRPFAEAALRAAVQELVDRHETLRTSFATAGYSVPLQLVHGEVSAAVVVHPDMGGHEEFVAAERSNAFALDQAPPLLRVAAHVETDEAWWLTIAVSHLVTGGWDFNTLLMEFVRTYRAHRDGTAAEQPEAAGTGVRYADFIAAEVASLESAEDQSYWRAIAEGYPAFVLPEGWGEAHAAAEAAHARVAYHDLDAALRSFAAAERVSVKSVLHAAHLKVLGQLTSERSFSSGLVCDARPEVLGADKVNGMYINTLPFAVERTAATWRELVHQAFDREVELWPHRSHPLPAIRRATGLGPLDVVFDFTDFHQVDLGAVDIQASDEQGATEFGLSVSTAGGFVNLAADGRVMSQSGLDRVAGMYRAVLEAIAADADGDARAVYLPAGELERILGEWAYAPNHAVTGAGEPRLAHEAFEARAAADPDAVAVVDDGSRLGYGELNARANRLAHHLRALGVGPEVLVGVCAERSVEQVIALLAVIKAGGGYVPLDPTLPAERLAFILEQIEAPIVLCDPSGRSALPAGPARLIALADPAPWAEMPATDPVRTADPAGTCYVVYTSGSTGRPKGVVNSHAALANRIDYVAREVYRLEPGSAQLVKTEIGFDVAVGEVLAALSVGARLVLAAPGGHRDPRYLRDLIAAEGVTAVDAVPTLLAPLLAAGLAECTGLRSLCFGGEEFPVDLARTLTAALPDCAVFNAYGPAEASIDVTAWQCTAEELAGLSRVPLGRAHPNVRLYVLDEDMRPVPAGVRGELYLGGVGLARGYYGSPELTAAAFVPDPFAPEPQAGSPDGPGARLYRTGDAVCWRPDGTLDFLGRVDAQVKLHGVRIEPGEIEAALRGCPGVTDAVVVVRTDKGRRSLVGYYVPRPGDATPAPAQLRSLLAVALPAAFVPAALVALNVLPLGPTGKVDRGLLPAPQPSDFPVGQYVAPRDPREEQVAAIWREVLGVDRVGVEDSFFDLGGDSLRAIALVGALHSAGYATSVREVFALRTVAELAAALTPLASAGAAARAAAVEPFALLSVADRAALPPGLADAYPLSQIQLGMVFELMAGEGPGAYQSVLSQQIRDTRPFEPEAFAAAVRAIVDRHEILRTSFALSGYATPLQLVHEAAEPRIVVEDGRGLPPQEQSAALAAYVAAERADRFEIGNAPLVRVAAHLASDDTWWLTFTIFHAVTEGWSSALLLEEVIKAYQRIRDGQAPDLPALPDVRYADFIAGELEALASPEDQAYWTGVVSGAARFTLPGWGEQGTATPLHGEVDLRDLDERLRELATAGRVSLKAVLHAAHLKVLSQLTGEVAFHAGLVCDARPERAGADRIQGMFLNTLPFVYQRSARTWRDLIRDVFDQEVELWPHRRYPMPAIQRGNRQRLIEVLFNYQDFSGAARAATGAVGGGDSGRVAGIGATEVSLGEGDSEFALSVISVGGRLDLTTTTAALSRANLDRLAGMYRAVLEAMAADPDGDAQATYLPAGERDRLISGGASQPAVAKVTHRLHELFEERVRVSPDAVAVVFEGVGLSYAGLNVRANRIARRLVGLGVGRECVVGVCLERGLDLVPALLGVLKSGAGYLPLDPVQPVERLGFMVGDAGVSVVVTDSVGRGCLPADFGGVVVVLDEEDLEGLSGSDLGVSGGPDDLVYVIYTSGSTGRPKGVCLSHGNVVRLLSSAQEHYGFDESDVWPLFHSYAFDVSVWELWGALLQGGRLVVVPRGVTRSPDDFLDLLVGHGVTVLNQTPSAFRGLVRLAGEGDPRIDRLSLRAVVFAGEKLEFAELAPWVARHSLARVALVNMYGITETTVHTTYHRIVRADLAPNAGNPIGRPLADLRVYLLDGQGNLVPEGVPGEIYVGGPGVARGYLGRPELTAERFVPDPFGGAPGSRLYRSGDLARRLPDGRLEFCGRIDDQVKIRGYRIELGEIEAALAAVPGIRDAVVVVREDTPGDKRLVAYLTTSSAAAPAPDPDSADSAADHAADDPLSPSALRATLARTLPEYMLPTAFVTLPALPLTPNGKLDKRALPDPGDSATARVEYVAPSTPVECALAEIWGRVLGIGRVGAQDRFFDLGGDSIRLIQVIADAQQAGLALSLRMFYEDLTLEQFAARVPQPGTEPGAADPAALADAAAPEAAAVPSTRGRGLRIPSPAATMAEHHVPGVAIALIEGGEIAEARAFGVLRADGAEPATADTVFQVGSVSKFVSVLGALSLVRDGRLEFDRNINDYLTSWRVPGRRAVSLRRLLGHLSGLTPVENTVFAPDEPLPGLPDLLDGRPPFRTPPVRVDRAPGTAFENANVNYAVLQQLIEDRTGTPFADLIRELVLDPLGMAGSGFEPDFPSRCGRPVAAGHDEAGVPVPGGWRVRPDTAAAGLWTTAPDLARAVIEVRSAYLGDGGRVLTRELAAEMLTPHPGAHYGLGTVVDDDGADLEYGHGGEMPGYRATVSALLRAGDGVVALTNGRSGREIARFLAARLRTH
ncbi:non-ribosomal peptide synthetase [Actinospica robiniae]|uniref:non-ribosomal peptide synthetase n=1 Tax=Actinospica robiniae TaxID=304901 RepID=UPI0003F4BB10|nr:non-ribosomal peptide synthetase [Actinospica robiniae]